MIEGKQDKGQIIRITKVAVRTTTEGNESEEAADECTIVQPDIAQRCSTAEAESRWTSGAHGFGAGAGASSDEVRSAVVDSEQRPV